jgi:predicted ATPase/class 3 adenylate cyclase
MAERTLPTGTVTFLFSDMEGSTRLVRDLGPAAFTDVLERHNAILRQAFAGHGATERGTQGDSFLVMFSEAPEAVAAAAEAQRALGQEAWSRGATVRVRMGLHTGVARLGGDDYVGLDVHRAARVAALGRGGQVLLSDATHALAVDAMPSGVSARSLGVHRLRDLDRPEHLHQLVIDGLPSEFPPLTSIAVAEGNLPKRSTSFVGRDEQLEALEQLLDRSPLVTLTGPGGTGKTRLAIEFARRRASAFADGAWLVRLDAISGPDLVLNAVAATFGLVESPATSPLERLHGFLADRTVLLVLDNFEHLLDAAPWVNELLEGAGGLRILVTSRAPLRLGLEQEFPVDPLSETEAISLFVERARRANATFGLSDDNRAAVAEICRHLDGLPLGIELAAARIGLLPATAIASQLTTRLDLPGPGPRDLPARQRTLAETVAWSYGLLDEPARRLLARSSVFKGGFRLAELEAVGGPADELGAEVIDALSSIVEQSLAEPAMGPDVPRYRLLETIRMFGAGHLTESGEANEIRLRHAAAYLSLAEEAARHMPGRDQVPWLDRLDVEHDNVRAAIAWAVAAGETEIAHRLASAMWRFWHFRGHVTEGRARMADVLAMPGADAPTLWRLHALSAAGGLDWWAGAIPESDAHYSEQLEVARALENKHGIADALFNLSHSRFALSNADFIAVGAIQAEAARLYRELGDEVGLARVEWAAGYPLMRSGRYEEAGVLIREALPRFEKNGDVFYVALASGALAAVALANRDLPTAIEKGILSLRSSYEIRDVASITLLLRSAAFLLILARRPDAAATVMGAYEAHCRRYGIKPPVDPESWLHVLGQAGELIATLERPELHEDRLRGEAMTTDGVVAYILDTVPELDLTTAPALP